jgi:hypothetical protein
MENIGSTLFVKYLLDGFEESNMRVLQDTFS